MHDQGCDYIRFQAFQEIPEDFPYVLIYHFGKNNPQITPFYLLRPQIVEPIRFIVLLDQLQEDLAVFKIGQTVLHCFQELVFKGHLHEGFIQDKINDLIFVSVLR